MEERGIEDLLPFDDVRRFITNFLEYSYWKCFFCLFIWQALFGDVANVSEIASVIFNFDTLTNVSQPSNISSVIVERDESDSPNLEESEEFDMDLEGLMSLKDDNNNSTAKVSNSSSELETSDEVKNERGVVVVVT